jgi:hypothetical protein
MNAQSVKSMNDIGAEAATAPPVEPELPVKDVELMDRRAGAPSSLWNSSPPVSGEPQRQSSSTPVECGPLWRPKGQQQQLAGRGGPGAAGQARKAGRGRLGRRTAKRAAGTVPGKVASADVDGLGQAAWGGHAVDGHAATR